MPTKIYIIITINRNSHFLIRWPRKSLPRAKSVDIAHTHTFEESKKYRRKTTKLNTKLFSMWIAFDINDSPTNAKWKKLSFLLHGYMSRTKASAAIASSTLFYFMLLRATTYFTASLPPSVQMPYLFARLTFNSTFNIVIIIYFYPRTNCAERERRIWSRKKMYETNKTNIARRERERAVNGNFFGVWCRANYIISCFSIWKKMKCDTRDEQKWWLRTEPSRKNHKNLVIRNNRTRKQLAINKCSRSHSE